MLTSRYQLHKAPNVQLHVGNHVIEASDGARNLGVFFDKSLTMERHIINVARSLNYHLRAIGSIRGVLTKSAAEQLMHSLITSRLDYCNSLLAGVPQVHLDKLQRCQNTAARIVVQLPKREHITPELKSLHWLPIHHRITFKLLLFTYRIINDMAPEYLSDIITFREQSYNTRSSDRLLLDIPMTNLKTVGDRAFSAAAPKLWNKLPENIQRAPSRSSFKTRLKSHLFEKSYKH